MTDNETTWIGIRCLPCSRNSYCPLASINDVNLSDYPSNNQAYPYPNSPALTSYDDIIIMNTFQINSSTHRCLLVSPMFWTLLVLALSTVILIIMGVLYWAPSGHRHFKCLVHVFRHTDLVGEGEFWLGGLVSFAIVVLVIFAFWFGSVFINQYPIETAPDAYFACDPTLRNAKFTSSLQMLADQKLQEEKHLFDLLDQQNWTMTVDFIQTGFKCSDIIAQRNVESYTIRLTIERCFLQPDNATRTIVLPLPNHLINVQFNLTGNSYIGAFRICINGSMVFHNESYSTVKELYFCQLTSNSDETISRSTFVRLDFTKVINRTEGLHSTDSTNYTGLWIPTMTVDSLNDRIAYQQDGRYIRYLSSQQILIFQLDETQFYIKNIQEPIAKLGEIVFNNILFFTACIELFGIAFLFLKLAILPLVQQVLTFFLSRKSKRLKLSETTSL